MAKRDQLIRLHSIIEKLRSQKEVSYNEINEYLKRKSEYSGYELTISQRGLQRDIQVISSVFDIEIECNSQHKYFIGTENSSEIQARALEAFDLRHLLDIKKDISSFVEIEKRSSGTENFYGIVHAIKKNLLVKITYKSFRNNQTSDRYVEPQALKEYRQRWYLLAFDRKTNEFRTFGLDRIDGFEITRQKFEPRQNFNGKEMFKNCFGIIIPNNPVEKPEKIILSFLPRQGQYFKTLPFHETQEILIDNEKEFRIQLNLYITDDFIRELLCNTEELIRVVSPVKLKKQLEKIYSQTLKRIK